MQKLLTSREVADLLNVTVPTVAKLARSGALPSAFFSRCHHFRLENVEAFITAAEGTR